VCCVCASTDACGVVTTVAVAVAVTMTVTMTVVVAVGCGLWAVALVGIWTGSSRWVGEPSCTSRSLPHTAGPWSPTTSGRSSRVPDHSCKGIHLCTPRRCCGGCEAAGASGHVYSTQVDVHRVCRLLWSLLLLRTWTILHAAPSHLTMLLVRASVPVANWYQAWCETWAGAVVRTRAAELAAECALYSNLSRNKSSGARTTVTW